MVRNLLRNCTMKDWSEAAKKARKGGEVSLQRVFLSLGLTDADAEEDDNVADEKPSLREWMGREDEAR